MPSIGGRRRKTAVASPVPLGEFSTQSRRETENRRVILGPPRETPTLNLSASLRLCFSALKTTFAPTLKNALRPLRLRGSALKTDPAPYVILVCMENRVREGKTATRQFAEFWRSNCNAQDSMQSFLLHLMCVLAAGLLLAGCMSPRGRVDTLSQTVSAEVALSSWNDDAPARTALVAYVKAVTDANGPDWIPPERRIAVFDLDGTLFCETDPNYFDYMLLVHRVTEDPDYRDRASKFERETVQKILEMNKTGVATKGLETDHGKAVASAFAGFTLDAFHRYIQDFKKLPMPSYKGMRRGEGFYRPMLQVADYLKANGFKIWVVSGTDRFIVRGLVSGSALDVPPERIIGSDEAVVATGQNGSDGLGYQLQKDDDVVLEGRFIVKNLKMNKVAAIVREIGSQPVLSFGNSTGDSSMAAYVKQGNPARSLAFMLCCDDTERENGNAEKAERMRTLCKENGWIPISMKDDWKTIYGDGVSKNTLGRCSFFHDASMDRQ